jgi:tight adherence protein C
MVDWIILGCLFLSVFGVSYLVVRWLTVADQRIDKRLTEGAASEGLPYDGQQLILGDLTVPLGKWTLADNGKKVDLTRELREAGYYRPTALVEYAALRAVLIGMPLFAALLLTTVVDLDLIPWVLGAGAVVAVLGYSLPRTYINYRARQRGRQIENGLPVAVDLLSLCLTGGQNLLSAVARVARDLEFSFPVLAQELRIVHKHAEMAGLELALQNFASRTNVQEAKNLSVILTHSERLGTDIASALLEFSSSYRQSMRQRAEAYANRVSFWMLFPTILCLLVPALLLFYAPLMHEFARTRRDLSEDTQKSFQKLQEISKKPSSSLEPTQNNDTSNGAKNGANNGNGGKNGTKNGAKNGAAQQ